WPTLALVMCVSACGGSTKTVTVTVASSAPKAVAVPLVVGLQESLALRKLTRSGLRGQVRHKRSATVRAGVVFEQTPLAGGYVSRGSTVTLLASAGSSQ